MSDGPGTITVTVEQKHRMAGLPGDCGGCPIAIAVMELLPEAEYYGLPEYHGIEVTTETISVCLLDKTWTARMPEAGADFIEMFDDEAVEPELMRDITLTLEFKEVAQ